MVHYQFVVFCFCLEFHEAIFSESGIMSGTIYCRYFASIAHCGCYDNQNIYPSEQTKMDCYFTNIRNEIIHLVNYRL